MALAAALLPTLINGQGASSMHPIDFDGDGDIDIVKSSPIGIVWLENHGVRAGAPENNTRRLFKSPASRRRRRGRPWDRTGPPQHHRPTPESAETSSGRPNHLEMASKIN